MEQLKLKIRGGNAALVTNVLDTLGTMRDVSVDKTKQIIDACEERLSALRVSLPSAGDVLNTLEQRLNAAKAMVARESASAGEKLETQMEGMSKTVGDVVHPLWQAVKKRMATALPFLSTALGVVEERWKATLEKAGGPWAVIKEFFGNAWNKMLELQFGKSVADFFGFQPSVKQMLTPARTVLGEHFIIDTKGFDPSTMQALISARQRGLPVAPLVAPGATPPVTTPMPGQPQEEYLKDRAVLFLSNWVTKNPMPDKEHPASITVVELLDGKPNSTANPPSPTPSAAPASSTTPAATATPTPGAAPTAAPAPTPTPTPTPAP